MLWIKIKKTLTISSNLKKKLILNFNIITWEKIFFNREKKNLLNPKKTNNKPNLSFSIITRKYKEKNFARKFVEQQATKDFIKKDNKPAGKKQT